MVEMKVQDFLSSPVMRRSTVRVRYPAPYLNNLGGTKMKPTIESLQIRIHKLQQKNSVINSAIINKLKRRVRILEK